MMRIRCLCIGLIVLLCCLSSFGSSIWSSSSVPALIDSGGSTNLELGVKFRSDLAGTVNGIRFYKAAANTGGHVGHLWSAAGALLGSVAFKNETASGWQEANFSRPILILPNVTYIASYWCPNGHFSLSRPYFSSTIDNAPLHALGDTVDGPNGVYAYPAGFPSATYQASNYWVDVDFTAAGGTSQNLTVTGVSPGSGALAGGTSTTIKATGLQPGAKAYFGGVPGTSNAVTSPTQMQSTSPAGAAGTVIVTVKNLDSAASTQTFTFAAVSPPLITSVLPPTGPTTGGTIVVIGGSNFSAEAIVKFGSTPAQSVTFVNSTQLTCLSPVGVTGSVPISVSNPDGQSVAMPAAFIYANLVPPPPPPPVSGPPAVSGGKGLLSGMTPSHFTVPAGWTLVHAVDFDNGSIGAGAKTNGASIVCGFGHSGNCALKGTYATGNSPAVLWDSQDLIGTRDTYISFWEYADPGGRMNSDYDIGGVSAVGVTDAYIRFQPGCGGHSGGGVNDIPYFWNALTQVPILYVEGDGYTTPNFATWGWGNECLSPNVLSNGAQGWGNWTQWEIRVRENPPTSPSSPADGEVQLYQNGVLVNEIRPFAGKCSSNPVPCSNLAGTRDFNTTHHTASVGGVYTMWISWKDEAHVGTCSPTPIPSFTTIAGGFNSKFPCPNQAPPNGWGGSTHQGGPFRYFDDIIVLKR